MGKIAELQAVIEKVLPQATEAQKSEFQKIRKEMDALDDVKKKHLDTIASEKDDDKRSKAQDALHAARDKYNDLNDKRKAMLNKYRGLRSK